MWIQWPSITPGHEKRMAFRRRQFQAEPRNIYVKVISNNKAFSIELSWPLLLC